MLFLKSYIESDYVALTRSIGRPTSMPMRAAPALSPGLKDKTHSSPAMQLSQAVRFSLSWQQNEVAGSVLLY